MTPIVIPQDIEALAKIAVDAGFCVHKELGPGLLESAYEACFAHELDLRGVSYQRQLPISLNYRDKLVDVGFRADFLLDRKLLIELKAVDEIVAVHKAQVITYLKILQLPLGLLINFNTTLIKHGIQRIPNLHLMNGKPSSVASLLGC